MYDVIAGFDIGGTKIAFVLADLGGAILHRSMEKTDIASSSLQRSAKQITYFGIADQMKRMLHTGLDNLTETRLNAIGVVSAGPLRDGGIWNPPNIFPNAATDDRDTTPLFIPLLGPLQEAFKCPVSLERDCSGAVLGEVYEGWGKEVRDKSTLHLAYVTLSTGFGAGIWDGGRLLRGKDGNAGEIGHIVARENGLVCGCGNRGCVEAYCSGTGIVRNAYARLGQLDPTRLRSSRLYQLAADVAAHCSSSRDQVSGQWTSGSPTGVTPELVFRAAAEEDPLARCVIHDAIYAAGIGFSALANAYDPQVVTVGGGIAFAHPELLEPIRQEMLSHLNVNPPEIHLTPLGVEVAEHGALVTARCAAGKLGVSPSFFPLR